MKSDSVDREEHTIGTHSSGSQLSRRKFLKWCGAAIGSGALLNAPSALGARGVENGLEEFSFQSNAE